jgi:light-regulated signal transduction histidine kinase (bacteriophytochrome)
MTCLLFQKWGRQDIIKTNINTNQMVKEIITELTPDIEETNIEWVVQSLPSSMEI